MDSDLLDQSVAKLHSLPVGTRGTLRKLCGDDLWLLLPSPRKQANLIAQAAGNLDCLGKDENNHLIYEVVA
jgi:hypothetical protein